MTCGQVFRWKKSANGWEGKDGAYYYSVSEEDSRLTVSTNGEQSDFESLFRFDFDHKAARESFCEISDHMVQACASHEGLRLMRPSNRFESLLSFLCTANNHLARITQMVSHLANLGTDGWPTVAQARATDEASLRAAGFGYRAKTIPEVVEIVHRGGGSSFLDDLSRADYESAHRELMGWPGVGPKLADCICLYALGHEEAVPVDTHMWSAVTASFFPEWAGSSLTEKKYRVVGDRFRDLFGRHAGFAQLLLYHGHLRGGNLKP